MDLEIQLRNYLSCDQKLKMVEKHLDVLYEKRRNLIIDNIMDAQSAGSIIKFYEEVKAEETNLEDAKRSLASSKKFLSHLLQPFIGKKITVGFYQDTYAITLIKRPNSDVKDSDDPIESFDIVHEIL